MPIDVILSGTLICVVSYKDGILVMADRIGRGSDGRTVENNKLLSSNKRFIIYTVGNASKMNASSNDITYDATRQVQEMLLNERDISQSLLERLSSVLRVEVEARSLLASEPNFLIVGILGRGFGEIVQHCQIVFDGKTPKGRIDQLDSSQIYPIGANDVVIRAKDGFEPFLSAVGGEAFLNELQVGPANRSLKDAQLLASKIMIGTSEQVQRIKPGALIGTVVDEITIDSSGVVEVRKQSQELKD